MRNVLTGLLAAGALLGAAGSASAATQTTTFNVTATVLKNCSAVTAPTLAFGNYTPGSGSTIDVNTTVSIACTKNTGFTVALNGGSTAGGTIAQRLMGDGAGDTLGDPAPLVVHRSHDEEVPPSRVAEEDLQHPERGIVASAPTLAG